MPIPKQFLKVAEVAQEPTLNKSQVFAEICGAGLFAIVMLGAIYTHATHNEFSRLPFNLFLLLLSSVIMVARAPALLNWIKKSARA